MEKQVFWISYHIFGVGIHFYQHCYDIWTLQISKVLYPYCKKNAALKAIVDSTTEASGRGNIVNINIKTSNESITSHPEDIPPRTFEQVTNPGEIGEVRRSRRVKSPKSYF
jgi:hypothetical protein